MTRALVLFLSALAVTAAGVAVWAGPELSIALPAGVLAALAASLLFVEVGTSHASFPSLRASRPLPPSTAYLRRAFTFGRLGRETILETLDRLERTGPNPGLPARDPAETRRILRMPRREFRAYLRARLDRLELAS